MAWLYVPEAEASKQDCTSSFQNIEPYVLLNGKPTPQPPSWSGWKRRAWARVLCGMTLPPSTLTHGVDSWISSLRDIRANRSATPEKVFAKMTSAISGLTSSGISAQLCRQSSGLKTLKLTLPGVSIPSETIWNELVTGLQRESLARQKLARRIFENDFLFSACWPTITVHGNHNRKGISPKAGDGLATAVNWPTPNTVDHKGGGRKNPTKGHQVQLCHIAGESWPTPRASDGPKGGPNQRGSKGDLMLPSAVQEFWQTPAAALATGGQTSRGGDRKGELLLSGQVMWATPKASQNGPDYARNGRKDSGADDLVTQVAKNWGTPTARDYKAGRGMKGQLTTHLQSGLGRPEEERDNSPGKSPGLLNPAWVEQLMGWVPGMSNFSCSETEWCRWLRQWRLWLFGKD